MEGGKVIDIQPLYKLKDLLTDPLIKWSNGQLNELGKMGAIQTFEVSYELSWKLMQKVLRWQGQEGRYPREIFRLAAQNGLIVDPKSWFRFLDKRNLTVHTYEADIISEIFSILPDFVQELNALIQNLKNFSYGTTN